MTVRREELVTFENQGQRIYGMIHRPDGAGPHPGVMLLHGFTGTRVEPHRIFVKLAREAAARGFVALRFDFRGSGESEGRFQDMTVSGEVDDAVRALDLLEGHVDVHPQRIGVLGLSLGGAVAALLAGKDPRVQSVVLWSAVADLAGVFGATMGGMLPRGDTDVGGDIAGGSFFAELPALHPLDAVGRYQGPLLVVHGTADATVPHENGVRLYEAAPGEKHLELIEGADHTCNSQDWERRVLDLTLDWWERTLKL